MILVTGNRRGKIHAAKQGKVSVLSGAPYGYKYINRHYDGNDSYLINLQEAKHIRTVTSGGKLIFHIFASLAEFERSIIPERTQAGLNGARARGRRGGRPSSLDSKQLQLVREMYADLKKSPKEICQVFNISRSALYRYVA